MSNYTHETQGYEIFFTLFSKTLHRVLHVSTALALKYAFLKKSLENESIDDKVLIFPSSFLILLTTLVAQLWPFSIVSRRLYSITTLGVTSFPQSNFHILTYGTNNFLSANHFLIKFKPA